MSASSVREYVKFQRMIGLIILVGLGIIPLLTLYAFDVMMFHPYVALISVISGLYIYINSWKYSPLGGINDR